METETRSRPELRPVWTGRGDHPQPSPGTTPLSATSPLYSASLSLPSPMHPTSPSYDPMRAHERALVDRLDRLDHLHRPADPCGPDERDSARGLPDGLPRSPLTPAITSAIDDRRHSLSPSSPSARRNSQQIQESLQDWGHVYFGNGPIADCFVSAVALRRHSDSSSTDGDAAAQERPAGVSNEVTIRARVRPCALNREPFLLKRKFSMDGLRATLPELPPLSAGLRRPSSELPVRSPLPTGRRRSSVAAGAKHGLDLDRSHVQSTSTVPIHATYARAFFPVLAAFLYSGHIEKGDIIDLPMPNPKAWAQTVAHVYTGQGELTEAIKQNIEYLGVCLLMAKYTSENPRLPFHCQHQVVPMSNVPNRRPPLATSVSTPDVFCRPMDPSPAPLVYINGRNGVGKETVAEYLTLLLGNENALLVDVRSVGREPASNSTCCSGSRTSKHKHHRQHEHYPLLTPEHPRYFSPDLDSDARDFSPLPSPCFSTSSSRSASFSSASTASTAATSTSSSTPTSHTATSHTATPYHPALKRTTPPNAVPVSPPIPTLLHSPANPSAQAAAAITAPSPPCSSENLTALLTRPPNPARIAVLPACCPDTAAGRAALRTFEAAAARAGRLFVGVVLRCADGAAAACVCWARGGGPDLGLARPTKAGLTVDASCRPPFDVALQIIGFVKGLQEERDAELCSNACSAVTAPGEALESEGKLEAPGVADGK
ncbi:hypothetical protein B0I37DRAFT_348794 [Chaetomium sp. MPI-CAGE-AT-0009]|nr:hypothetical protein B0I37DRAFT_348794 [Chaetomium sp. MPI-CAGE-AT-0009]